MPKHLGTIGYVPDTRGRWDAFLCGFWFIGHSWQSDTPERLVNSGHVRLKCRRCMILRYRFRAQTQEELDGVMNITAGDNREARRALTKNK